MNIRSSIFYGSVVLLFAVAQQFGRTRNCTVCRINALPAASAHFVSFSKTTTVNNDAQLRDAIAKLSANSTIKVAPGTYKGGWEVRAIEGLTVEAADPRQPPVFVGGGNAWHFSACSKLTLRSLIFQEQTGNGINIDDGGKNEPTTDVTLERLQISDVGPKGNHDGIKLSGIDRLNISHCTLHGWGGQGIDMVGCHVGTVSQCRFEGKEGFTASAAVQTKGGSADIVIEDCLFKNAGERPLNIGGSTGLDYFRPKDATYEATRIIARRNRIEGSLCAAAFVGVDGAVLSDNTILYPKKWVFRILQETNGERFVPCRHIKVENNRIAFNRAEIQVECNVGGGTAANTSEFRGNHWFAADQPSRSKPKLPVEEIDGHYGVDWSKAKNN